MTKVSISQSLNESINQLLQEIRIVLPGTQAFLGFQLMAVFQQRFSELAEYIQYTHLFSLFCMCLATILLMSPAAYDWVVEKDKISKEFYDFASRIVIFALLFLGAGIAGDVFVVSFVVTEHLWFSVLSGAGVLLLSYTLWFYYTLRKRHR